MTRALSAASILLALCAVIFLFPRTCHGPEASRWHSPSVVDSSRVVAVQDSLELLQLRHQLDSLRAWIATAPPESVVVRLPGATRVIHDTARVSVPVVVIRETADSLAQCRHDRDSATGEVLVERERRKSYGEALSLCQRSLGELPAPSSGGTTWTVSGVLQADGEALRPGVGLDWRPFEHLQVGAEGYARRDGARPGGGLRVGFSW